MVDFGKFKHRVQIQSMDGDGTADDYNYDEPVPVTIATRWAKIKPLTGKQLEYGKQINELVTTQVNMRYYAGLTPDHQLLFGTRIFNILSVINVDEANEEHIVMCVETITKE